MTETNQLLFTVRIPGRIEQHRNLLKEMWRSLEDAGDYPQFVPLGVIPHIEGQSSPESVSWQIRYELDPAHPQLHFQVFDLAKPNRVGAIQIAADGENHCLVTFIDAFSLNDQTPGKTLARFPALAKRFAFYLQRKKQGHIVEIPKEQPSSEGEEISVSAEIAAKYPNITRLLPYARQGFKEGFLRLSDKEKNEWEKIVTMIKEGYYQYQIAQKLQVDVSLISKRLNAKGRFSLGLKTEEIRGYLS
ncbi:MAG: hypothetical protein HS126_00070 [Anaerolineales bacterium]|nr:hypothetical protein [Anaerolineales bacterium]